MIPLTVVDLTIDRRSKRIYLCRSLKGDNASVELAFVVGRVPRTFEGVVMRGREKSKDASGRERDSASSAG